MPVDVSISDHVAVVTMDRPEALNAFDTTQLRAFVEAFRRLRSENAVRAVILTGAGDRAFAAGADIKAMARMSRREGDEFGRLGHAAANEIETLPKPVIAAVNGFALGGGSELALACDIRLASENAVFAQPEVTLGIPPGWGATQRLTRLIGSGLASEIIFTGRRVRADEALRIGLVNSVHTSDELLPAAKTLAATIARNSPRAVSTSKQLIHLAFNGAMVSGLDVEAGRFGESFDTADQIEGMTAFVEKRTPRFED